jgi:hypothetical protein
MNMFYGVISGNSVPADEQEVRATTEPINADEAPAVMQDAPVTGHVETDSTPGISGLHNHQLASQWVDSEQFTPFWIGNVDADAVNGELIDGQVSSSGTAAAREAQGIFGHGSLAYAIGIEPVQGLAPGGQFGETYFAADKPNIQSTMGSYMSSPPGYDKEFTAAVSDTVKRQARYAKESSLYAHFLGTDH